MSENLAGVLVGVLVGGGASVAADKLLPDATVKLGSVSVGAGAMGAAALAVLALCLPAGAARTVLGTLAAGGVAYEGTTIGTTQVLPLLTPAASPTALNPNPANAGLPRHAGAVGIPQYAAQWGVGPYATDWQISQMLMQVAGAPTQPRA